LEGKTRSMKADIENQIVNGVTPRERPALPVASGTRIGHVHLKTADIDRIYKFYVDILGFDVVFRRPDALFLSAGGYHHHLGFNTWESKGGTPPPRGTGYGGLSGGGSSKERDLIEDRPQTHPDPPRSTAGGSVHRGVHRGQCGVIPRSVQGYTERR